MSSNVISDGIFHGLPTYPDSDVRGGSIIVTGANGISGSEMVNLLTKAPERWHTIYALSRKPPTSTDKHVVPVAADFLNSSPSQIAAILREHKVQADYILFASYIQAPPLEGQGLWSDSESMTKLNVQLLTNFLDALPLANITPKRILLQTGGKYYGLHIGPTATPMVESALRHGIEPNFYFPQEDALIEYCRANNSSWTITRPAFIWGASENASMSIAYPLAVYASVQRHLGRPLAFPGDIKAWEVEKHQSNAKLLARHAEWALLSSQARNKALNQSDSNLFTWGGFWPALASWYQIEAGRPNDDEAAYSTLKLPHDPPPRGFGGPGIIRSSFTFLEWSKDPEVFGAWEELKKRHHLEGSPLGDKALDTFGLLDVEVLPPWPRSLSMTLNNKLGWHGSVDTEEAIKEVFEEMADKHMVPPFPAGN